MPKTKLTVAQMNYILDRLENEGDSLLREAREYLVSSTVSPLYTNEELMSALVKLAYDKPKVLARLYLDGAKVPMAEQREHERSQAYEKVEDTMAGLRQLVEQEISRAHGEMLWDKFLESPLDTYLDDVRGIFMGGDEDAEED